MLRTKLYQERDQIDPFKQHDFVEARQHEKWEEKVRQSGGLSPGKALR